MSEPLDLPALKKLCEKATPGPWEAHLLGGGKGHRNDYSVVADDLQPSIAKVHRRLDKSAEDDAKFIAAARTAVPQLIEEVEELRALSVDGAICGKISDLVKENTALKAEVERLKGIALDERYKGPDFANWENVNLKRENQALREENEKLKAHFDNCSAEKIVELRQELGNRFNEIRSLRFTLDQGKNDVAQMAAMCNEIVKLRELLKQIQGHCGHPDAAEGCRIIIKRIDAVLGEK